MTIKEAGQMLGVADIALRRWDASSKSRALSLYRKRDVLRLHRQVTGASARPNERD